MFLLLEQLFNYHQGVPRVAKVHAVSPGQLPVPCGKNPLNGTQLGAFQRVLESRVPRGIPDRVFQVEEISPIGRYPLGVKVYAVSPASYWRPSGLKFFQTPSVKSLGKTGALVGPVSLEVMNKKEVRC